uniref:F-box domain-containing protein n=1 Tax=Aegilops tauschii TaxID=37682 RepID=M8B2W4_AEGTA
MADARAGAEIGNDALREVFARLPGLRDLLRCAATCKQWRPLVTDRDFLRGVGLWQETARRPCVLAGIFSQNIFSVDDSRTKRTPYAPPRFLSLQTGLDVRDRRLTFDSFVTIGDDDRLFHLAKPLASRRGFLLTRLLLPSSSPGDHGGRQNILAVCRPLLDRTRLYRDDIIKGRRR